MRARIETNISQKVFATFLLALLILSGFSIAGCSSKEPAAADYSASRAFSTVAENIKKTVKDLEYPDEIGQDFVKMVSGWRCDAWKQRLDKAKQEYQQKKISAAQVVRVEKDIVNELCFTIRKYISYNDDFKYYDLINVVKDKKAHCLGMAQLLYILAQTVNAVGASTQV